MSLFSPGGIVPHDVNSTTISRNQRKFAVGDVHGCILTLRKLVEEVIQLRPQDVLYFLGDLIDRGPSSKGVLDYVIDLAEKGYHLRALRGNHEQMLLDSVDDDEAFKLWRGNGGGDLLTACAVDHPRRLPSRYLDLIKLSQFIEVLDDYVLVHAGLNFKHANPLLETSPHDMLWLRDYRLLADKLNGMTLITGHTVTPLHEIEQSLATQHIKLDNGCYDKNLIGHGNLVALDLDLRKLVVVKNCEVPP